MGNCQAIDAATLVVQYPSGKEEKMYWPVTASEIMKSNPNHHVALLITSTLCPSGDGDRRNNGGGGGGGEDKKVGSGLVRVTRVKVLKSTDTLVLGQVYRLITAQEVAKALRAKKEAKMMKKRSNRSEEKRGRNAKPEVFGAESAEGRSDDQDQTNQAIKQEKDRSKTATSTAISPSAKLRTWQPSLQSISEAGC